MKPATRHGTGHTTGIYTTATYRADNSAGRLTIQLRYRPTVDPVAVELRFPKQRITWRLARDLLADGCPHAQPGGCADVHVYNGARDEPPIVHLALRSEGGVLVLDLNQRHVAQFLDNAYLSVPRGSEPAWLDWDATVGAIIRAGA